MLVISVSVLLLQLAGLCSFELRLKSYVLSLQLKPHEDIQVL